MSFPSKVDWFERNGDKKTITYGADNIAPHAATTRATYTVPAGKKAIVMSAQSRLIRQTAAGTPGRPESMVWDGTVAILQSRLIENSNAQGDRNENFVGYSVILDAGDSIFIRTFDDSTTGTISYLGTVYFREFDA